MTLVGDSVIVQPGSILRGTVEAPGDKSISHRVAMLASLASGTSIIKGFLQSDDCMDTLRAMTALGARSHFASDGELKIHGTKGKVLQPAGILDMGNSGTGMRLLSGLLAGLPVFVELTGDESLLSRPMTRIQEPLRKMGAQVELLGEDGRGPIRVQGGNLNAIEYILPVASAQVKSCVLLAGLYAKGTTVVIEPAPSRDHTERLLKILGVPLRVDDLRIEIDGFGVAGPRFEAREFFVPGDFSSAAYFIVAAAGREGSEITVRNVGLNPRRTALLDVLKRMGAKVSIKQQPDEPGGEPYGDVTVTGAELSGTEVGGSEIPALIDELPLVAVAGAVAKGETVIRDAAELRVKESDRISAMADNMRRMGVEVREMDDGMVIQGTKNMVCARALSSFMDHRIAMAMAVLALYAESPVCVNNTACVNTSYPQYWEDLRNAGADVE